MCNFASFADFGKNEQNYLTSNALDQSLSVQLFIVAFLVQDLLSKNEKNTSLTL
jgi:hypothetical protein